MDKLFQDLNIIKKIQKKLPTLFQLSEIDNQRNGKLGMEIGSARERIIIALLIYQFGEENITTNISIGENETDVIVFKEYISIKTVTNKKIVGFKLIWTVDAQKSLEFINTYKAKCNMLFIHINWNGNGGMYLIPKEVQTEILNQHDKEFYFKLPKQGTNPRGVEITNEAINKLTKHSQTKMIKINWFRSDNESYKPYDKWVDLWKDKKDKIS
ncbi:MAG: ThaI family type II restriction endonuclease [Aliarcobacter sp.]|nr:ThaI family type II restriction endonuclease [Aliarcobacter sp.]